MKQHIHSCPLNMVINCNMNQEMLSSRMDYCCCWTVSGVMQRVAGSHIFIQTNMWPLNCWSMMRHEKTHPFSSSPTCCSVISFWWTWYCWPSCANLVLQTICFDSDWRFHSASSSSVNLRVTNRVWVGNSLSSRGGRIWPSSDTVGKMQEIPQQQHPIMRAFLWWIELNLNCISCCVWCVIFNSSSAFKKILLPLLQNHLMHVGTDY